LKEKVQESIKELMEKLRAAIIRKKVKIRKGNLGSRKWWDKNCRESKTRLNKTLRKYRRGKSQRRNI